MNDTPFAASGWRAGGVVLLGCTPFFLSRRVAAYLANLEP
jgi:hypothetical protein